MVQKKSIPGTVVDFSVDGQTGFGMLLLQVPDQVIDHALIDDIVHGNAQLLFSAGSHLSCTALQFFKLCQQFAGVSDEVFACRGQFHPFAVSQEQLHVQQVFSSFRTV